MGYDWRRHVGGSGQRHDDPIGHCERILRDEDIDGLRASHPEGLHFVVGDLHGEVGTLTALMEKLRFDPQRDRVYFVGDYNDGGRPDLLLTYMSRYYQPDPEKPGFHMLRGNHERMYGAPYPLPWLPDILALRGRTLTFLLTHAGLPREAYALIEPELRALPVGGSLAYRMDDDCASERGCLRQVSWSKWNLYRADRHRIWPAEAELARAGVCVLHGHTPYVCLMKDGGCTYGERSLFWETQRVLYSEDLRSFDLDSNVKGKYHPVETYRGLACVCLELLEEAAERSGGELTIEALRTGVSPVFSMPLVWGYPVDLEGEIGIFDRERPDARRIYTDANGNAALAER